MEPRIVADPHWGWWIVLYFFFGGIAAGAYFIGTMVDLFGRDRDRPIARLAYLITAPLVAICGLLLVVDLSRPERFWHMLIQSNTGLPMFKYWSPMSVGSWALMLFGLFSGLSFVGVLAEDKRFGLGRFSAQATYLHRGPVGVGFEVLGTLVGFFIAAYTGALLTATNQPIWSDSNWIAPLFLASAASTGISTLLLILSLRRLTPESSLRRLERTDRWAMVLELLLLVIFFVSLGAMAPVLLGSVYGILLLVGVLLVGVLIPLGLSFRPLLGARTPVVASLLALVGGFILRYAVVFAGSELPQLDMLRFAGL
jgi:formate-dependent nitrite reductase membrane component NrfD